MSLPRFYLPADQADVDEPRLRGKEAHHCIDVLRLRQGDDLILFDGRGREIQGSIASVSGGEVVITPRVHDMSEPLRPLLTLVQAIPKGKNMELIVQKATELGVGEIIPVVSDRAVVRIDRAEARRKREKWQRVAIEASKQCGQNWLPEVREPLGLEAALAIGASQDLKLVAALESDARPMRDVFADVRADQSADVGSVLICIGPEGDFTPAEANMARSMGCRPVTLGPIVLRTETAAMYCLAVLNHEWRG